MFMYGSTFGNTFALEFWHVPSAEVGGYEECYPATYDFTATIVDGSDEEGGEPPKPAAAVAEPDEAAASKSAKKEAMKAEQKMKAKEANEMQKIEKIFEEKGYKKFTAFDEKKKSNKPARNNQRWMEWFCPRRRGGYDTVCGKAY